MKRRNFLLAAAAGLAVVAEPDHVFARALAQAPLPGLPGSEGRCLVLVNLYGGNDGLNCVVPHGDAGYYQLRPGLAIAQSDVLAIDAHVGLNPGMRSFKALYDKGMVAIVQGVGYPNPDHSHFRSTEIWQTAAPDRYEHTGWLGRYFDAAGLPTANLFKGVALSRVLPEALVSNRTDIPAIPGLGQYALMANRNQTARNAFWRQAHDRSLPFDSPYLAHVMEIEGDAQRSSEELPKLVAGYTTKAAYPATGIGRSLALAAQIVGSNLGTRVIYVEHGSFDTHVNQKTTQNSLLTQFSECHRRFLRRLGRARERSARADVDLQRVRPSRRRERQPWNRPWRGFTPLFDRRRRQRRSLRDAAEPDQHEHGQRALYRRFSQRLCNRTRTLVGTLLGERAQRRVCDPSAPALVTPD